MKMLMVLTAAALIAGGAQAQTAAAPKAAPKPAAAVVAKPAPAVKAAPAAKAPAGKLVATTTKTGKKITYDCSKKGNLNKKACKG